jgi:iron complex transport system substrate-binding protein
VSLIASATETVCALGCEERLVGRSHECDVPDSVRRLPACSAPRLDADRPSRDIDRSVRSILEQALSVYRVDADRLRGLRPDLIITQTLCDVCAVSLRDVEGALAEWTGRHPALLALNPMRLEDVWDDIGRVAEALGVSERGRALRAELERRVRAIAESTARIAARPRVACIEWIDPLMAAGNWMPELVALAGGMNLFGEAGRHSPSMTWKELAASDPDIIVVLPCGFDLERTALEALSLQDRPEWEALRAARAGDVFIADGHLFFNRPGPRLVESLEILAEILHPSEIHYGHEGSGWRRLAPGHGQRGAAARALSPRPRPEPER